MNTGKKFNPTSMEYRKLGSADLELSVVTFGAWAAGGMMWGGTNHQASVDAMRASYDLGVTTFDTAPVYGMGYSEQLVGEAIKGLPRDRVQLLTKFGLSWDNTLGEYYFDTVGNDGKPVHIYRNARKEFIIKECEASLKQLGTDYIDLYQIHWSDPTTPVSESMEAVAKLIEQGKVRFAGVCNYSVELMEEASNYVSIVSEQVPYSMVKRGIEAEIIPYCQHQGLGILAYSPLQRGLLTGKMHPGHAFEPNDSRIGQVWYKDENLKRINAFLKKLEPLAESKNASIGQLVIRWTLEQPGITVALVGARNTAQAIQNAEAALIHLNAEELTFISAELQKVNLIS
jgi:aryl-alcohol dehydrogenase-like predicted oxidoreductase